MEPLGAELEFETPKAESNKASRSRSVTVRFLPSINSLFDGPPRPVGNASPMRERKLRAELPLAGNVDAEAAVGSSCSSSRGGGGGLTICSPLAFTGVGSAILPFQPFQPCLTLAVGPPPSLSDRSGPYPVGHAPCPFPSRVHGL